MVWSHNDQWMVTADHAGFIKYWQSNMNNVKMYQGHKEPIRSIRWEIVPHCGKYQHCSKVYITLQVTCVKLMSAKERCSIVWLPPLVLFQMVLVLAMWIVLENSFYLTQTILMLHKPFT